MPRTCALRRQQSRVLPKVRFRCERTTDMAGANQISTTTMQETIELDPTYAPPRTGSFSHADSPSYNASAAVWHGRVDTERHFSSPFSPHRNSCALPVGEQLQYVRVIRCDVIISVGDMDTHLIALLSSLRISYFSGRGCSNSRAARFFIDNNWCSLGYGPGKNFCTCTYMVVQNHCAPLCHNVAWIFKLESLLGAPP